MWPECHWHMLKGSQRDAGNLNVCWSLIVLEVCDALSQPYAEMASCDKGNHMWLTE